VRETASSFFAGVGLLLRGVRMYAKSPRLLLLGLIPAVITTILFTAAFVALVYFIGDLSSLVTWFADDWPSGWRTTVHVVAGAGLIGISLFIWALTFTAVTLAIGDPFYELIAEKVEDSLGGAEGIIDLPWYRELGRSARDAVRMIGISMLFGVPLFLAGFLPIVGQTVVPVIGGAVGGWFLAVELVGVAFNRRGLRLRDRRAALAKHRPLALGFGAAVFVCFLVPLGAVLIMPAAVAGGTLLARKVLGVDPTPA
jgi:CysZ protein